MNKKEIKKIIAVILIICICVSFCGCWDYVGLNQIGIVLGVAIDKNDDSYKLTLEIIDLKKSSKDAGVKPQYIECEGSTLIEAVRNSKSRSATKMFWGQIAILIISEQVAKEEYLLDILNLFIRDAEPRETIHLLISKEKTAKDLLKAKGLTNPLNSLEIVEIIRRDHEVTSKTGDIQLYQAFGILLMQGKEAVLPAFHVIKNDDETTSESDGVAVFKKGKMIGYLSPEDTFFYLYVVNEIKGGIFSVKLDKDKENKTAFEINGSKTKMDYEYDEKKDKFKIVLEIETNVFIAESSLMQEPYNEKEIEKIQKEVGEYLKQNIAYVIKKVQTEYDCDIFGFGNLIYRKKPKLWDKVSKDWDKYFKEIEVEIKANVQIKNTAFVTK